MPLKPISFRWSKTSVRLVPNPFMYGPDNLNKPLSRASQMAERVHQQTPSSTNYQQRRYFSYYYYQFPKIPRPKETCCTILHGQETQLLMLVMLTNLVNVICYLLAVSRFRKDCLPMPIKIENEIEKLKMGKERRRFIRWWTVTSLTIVLGGCTQK